MAVGTTTYVKAADLNDLTSKGRLVVHMNGHTIVLFVQGSQVLALDNRCPHMGFPLHRGSVQDGILTCDWHHARFDMATGGTFDPWADDVSSFPVAIRDGEVWVDLATRPGEVERQRRRLGEGLERNIPLVAAKACISLFDQGESPGEPFAIGLGFGLRNRRGGWGQGLTIHACLMNLVPRLYPEDRPLSLFHGLSAVASDSFNMPARFTLRPLPGPASDIATLKRWFRRFVEVRDAEGAERCLVSALEAGAGDREMADMMFAAASDHRYIQVGHTVDFTNKAFEALDAAGWGFAPLALTSLASGYAAASRMEESNAWRHPIDLVVILEEAFEVLPEALEIPRAQMSRAELRTELVDILLGDDPKATTEAMLACLRRGMGIERLARVVTYAAALRIARFHLTNEFPDWDTALHTFTFANAVHQGLSRAPSKELARGVFDAAMSVYLDRFLNVPATRIPEADTGIRDADPLLSDLVSCLDTQRQVNEAARLVSTYLGAGGDPDRLLATLGRLLLREDRDFHTIQTMEAAFRQFNGLRGTQEGSHVLIAAVRYLAAHSPTVRAQGQTYQIAKRLHRGDRLYEEAED